MERLNRILRRPGPAPAVAAPAAARQERGGVTARDDASRRPRRASAPGAAGGGAGSGGNRAAAAEAAPVAPPAARAGARGRKLGVLPASAAEMHEACTLWSVQLDSEELAHRTDGDVECVVCLGEMEPHQTLVQLPCSGEGEQSCKAHIFHADCLGRWLLTSAACPVCRRGVRPMLTRARGSRAAGVGGRGPTRTRS